jgi:hypothetical protein
LTTKWDLYTYSTTDARLPVWTNWYVLTADSAETTWLKWSASAWWWISPYESTVWATWADYTTLWAAVTAWKLRVLVIDDTTETWNITMPSNFVVHWLWRDEVNINMWTYTFLDNSWANSSFQFRDVKITCAYTVASTALFFADKLSLENVYIDNNSTATWTRMVSALNKDFFCNNLRIDLPNVSWWWVYCNSSDGDWHDIRVYNLTINWWWSSSSLWFQWVSDYILNWLTILWSWNTTSPNVAASFGRSGSSNITCFADTKILLQWTDANINNCHDWTTSGLAVEVDWISSSGCNMSDITHLNSSSDINITWKTNITNFQVWWNLVVESWATWCKISNWDVNGTLTVNWDKTIINWVDAVNLTIAATADYTIVDSTLTDNAITNSWTNTTLWDNNVY